MDVTGANRVAREEVPVPDFEAPHAAWALLSQPAERRSVHFGPVEMKRAVKEVRQAQLGHAAAGWKPPPPTSPSPPTSTPSQTSNVSGSLPVASLSPVASRSGAVCRVPVAVAARRRPEPSKPPHCPMPTRPTPTLQTAEEEGAQEQDKDKKRRFVAESETTEADGRIQQQKVDEAMAKGQAEAEAKTRRQEEHLTKQAARREELRNEEARREEEQQAEIASRLAADQANSRRLEEEEKDVDYTYEDDASMWMRTYEDDASMSPTDADVQMQPTVGVEITPPVDVTPSAGVEMPSTVEVESTPTLEEVPITGLLPQAHQAPQDVHDVSQNLGDQQGSQADTLRSLRVMSTVQTQEGSTGQMGTETNAEEEQIAKDQNALVENIDNPAEELRNQKATSGGAEADAQRRGYPASTIEPAEQHTANRWADVGHEPDEPDEHDEPDEPELEFEQADWSVDEVATSKGSASEASAADSNDDERNDNAIDNAQQIIKLADEQGCTAKALALAVEQYDKHDRAKHMAKLTIHQTRIQLAIEEADAVYMIQLTQRKTALTIPFCELREEARFLERDVSRAQFKSEGKTRGWYQPRQDARHALAQQALEVGAFAQWDSDMKHAAEEFNNKLRALELTGKQLLQTYRLSVMARQYCNDIIGYPHR